MHLTALLNVVRRRRMAVAGGQERRAAAFAASIRPRRLRDGGVIDEPARTDAPGDDRRSHADGVANRGRLGFRRNVTPRKKTPVMK